MKTRSPSPSPSLSLARSLSRLLSLSPTLYIYIDIDLSTCKISTVLPIRYSSAACNIVYRPSAHPSVRLQSECIYEAAYSCRTCRRNALAAFFSVRKTQENETSSMHNWHPLWLSVGSKGTQQSILMLRDPYNPYSTPYVCRHLYKPIHTYRQTRLNAVLCYFYYD